MKKICITGAAGNLGQLSARFLLENSDCQLNLMIHNKPLADEITAQRDRVQVFRCDLSDPESSKAAIQACFDGVDVVLHYASVLFRARPEQFMPTTNTRYFEHVVTAARQANVQRVILSSFPHVEGATSPDAPATDRLDGTPISIHAQTRLAEERYLRQVYPEGVILRIGMVYGAGILMPDAARWFAKRRLLGVWKKPIGIHLISRTDYLRAVQAAVLNEGVCGTYNLGDEGVQTLQDYLDFACAQWHCPRPWRMPDWVIASAARLSESVAGLTGLPSPLTGDFLRIGQVAYYGDTRRMRQELLPVLRYPTMREGAEIF